MLSHQEIQKLLSVINHQHDCKKANLVRQSAHDPDAATVENMRNSLSSTAGGLRFAEGNHRGPFIDLTQTGYQK